MSNSNPVILDRNIRFRPASTRSPSRSPSRSPVRKAQFTAQEIDPLLGNLSPKSTIKALSLTEALSANPPNDADFLARSITNASTTERAHGIKAAVAAQKLREWHAEVRGWKWPAKTDRSLGKGFQPRSMSSLREESDSKMVKPKEYAGSLPSAVVAHHEERIEEIKDGLEALDVEELKTHVLNAHIPSKAEDTTTNGNPQGLVRLSDFTAVITHTMLQALPYLSKLTVLLHDWDIRIMILKQVPHLLNRLDRTEQAIESASKNVYARSISGLLTRARFEETRVVLGKDVSLLGATFDNMLDLLEGREDSLPGSWIDQMDKIEANYAQWIVEAERKVLYNEWMEQNKTAALQDQDARVANAPNGTTVAGKQSLQPNGHAQSFTGKDDEVGSDHSIGRQHHDQPQPQDKYQLTQNLLEQGNSSPVSPDLCGPSVLTAPCVTSNPGDGHAGKPLLEETQSGVYSETTSDLVAPSSRVQETKDKLSEIIHQESGASPTASNLSPSSGSPTSVLSTTKPEQRFNAASGRASMSAKSLPRENLFARRSSRSPLTEPNPESPSRHYIIPPDNESSSLASAPQTRKPLTLSLPQTNHLREMSDISMADSTLPEAFSDTYNAEIVHATTAESLGSPRIVSHSIRASRDDMSSFMVEPKKRIQSIHIPRNDLPLVDRAGKTHKKAVSMSFDKMASAGSLPIKISDTVVDGEDGMESLGPMPDQPTPQSVPSQRTVIHRASISCMEKVPRNRIRSIMVNRRDSSSSSVVSSISPLDANGSYTMSGSAMSVSPIENGSLSSQSKRSSRKDYFEAVGRKDQSSPIQHPVGSQHPNVKGDSFSIPGIPRRSSKRLSAGGSPKVVPTSSNDTNGSAVPTNGHEPLDVHAVLQGWSRAASPTKRNDNNAPRTPSKGKGKGHEDLLESKIQSLISGIPARIQLLSNSDPDSPPRPSTASSSRSQSPIPSIILSPVKQKLRPQANNTNTPISDVRMFHLSRSTESKNTPPTKLHVRLVGEHGERVMVRVGGGWADLGDYLRDYSLHHSNRGLNNAQFELASFPTSGQKSSKDSRVISLGPELISKAASSAGPISSKSKSPANSRPGSAMDHRPSAATPFGILRPTRRRRSTSATTTQESDRQDFTSSPPIYALPSYLNNPSTDRHPPPVPSLPQIRTLNPYFNNDHRGASIISPRERPAATNSPTTPIPSQSQCHNHIYNHAQKPSRHTLTPTTVTTTTTTSMTSTPMAVSHQRPNTSHGASSAGAGTKSKPHTHRASEGGLVTTRSRPITPAAGRYAVDSGVGFGDEDGEGSGAPAPNIGALYASPTGVVGNGSGGGGATSPKSASSRMSSLGDKKGGGIRRVFFRRKGGHVNE